MSEQAINDNVPAEVFCLAEFVADELTARGWTTAHLAVKTGHRDQALGIAQFKFDMLLAVPNEKLLMDDETFADLARSLGVSEQMLRRIDKLWRDHPDRRSPFKAPESVFAQKEDSFYHMPDDFGASP